MGACFTSDNAAAISPEILQGIVAANSGMAPGYGADELTQELQQLFSEVFEHSVDVFLVGTGTAANALALGGLCPPWGGIFCHADAHIAVDECGAPEFFTGGAKLFPLAGSDGKLQLASLRQAYARLRIGDQHQVQPSVVSLSQATEAGTLYDPAEIAAIAAWARPKGIRLHMDGARFANAVVGINTTPAMMTWRSGIDVLSFGATKNGGMAAEAVITFDPTLATQMLFRRKRAGHLFSKSRFIAAQFKAYFDDDLWRRNAAHANAMARRLGHAMSARSDISLVYPVEANEVFLDMSDAMATALRDTGFAFHDWPAAGVGGRRLVMSFSTTEKEVDDFVTATETV